jgi:copper homeostasis protein CutC
MLDSSSVSKPSSAASRHPLPMIGTLFEACVDSLEETRDAAASGADRVELCVDMAHDGRTPPLALVAECSAIGIPVIAMVRPRPGDFTYSRAEIDAMRRHARARALRCLGVRNRRVLTSGAAPSAIVGIGNLRRLTERAAGRIEVIAAGSIRVFNLDRLIAATKAPAVHARWSGWTGQTVSTVDAS